MTWRRNRLLAALMALLAGCSRGGAGDPSANRAPASRTTNPQVDLAAPVPVAPSVLPAGSKVDENFVVPKGAVLLSRPIPLGFTYAYKNVPVMDRGWTATMVVAGDPRPVVDDIRRQAKALGIELHPWNLSYAGAPTAFCRTSETDYGRAPKTQYVCEAFGFSGPDGSERSVVVDFVRGDADGELPPLSTLLVRYSDSDRPYITRSLYPLGAPANAPLGEPAPPATSDWPPLPHVGQRFARGLLNYGSDYAGLRVVKGSALLAHPRAPSQGSIGTGYDALLAISGDPEVTYAGYAEQITNSLGRKMGSLDLSDAVTFTSADGATVRQTHAGIDGGENYRLTLVERPGSSATLAIQAVYG